MHVSACVDLSFQKQKLKLGYAILQLATSPNTDTNPEAISLRLGLPSALLYFYTITEPTLFYKTGKLSVANPFNKSTPDACEDCLHLTYIYFFKVEPLCSSLFTVPFTTIVIVICNTCALVLGNPLMYTGAEKTLAAFMQSSASQSWAPGRAQRAFASRSTGTSVGAVP